MFILIYFMLNVMQGIRIKSNNIISMYRVACICSLSTAYPKTFYANCVKNCNEIVRFTVSKISLVKF